MTRTAYIQITPHASSRGETRLMFEGPLNLSSADIDEAAYVATGI